MKHDFLDKYSDGESFIHRLDPRTKLLLSLLLITAIVLTPVDSWLAYGLFLAVILVWLGLSHLPPGYVFKRSLVIMPFVLLIAVFVPFFKEGDVAAVINLGSWQITLSDSGLEVLRNVLVRAWLSIITLVMLAATTSVSSLLKAMERLKMPSVMVMLLSFMYRYIFVLTDEVLPRLARRLDPYSVCVICCLMRNESGLSFLFLLMIRVSAARVPSKEKYSKSS